MSVSISSGKPIIAIRGKLWLIFLVLLVLILGESSKTVMAKKKVLTEKEVQENRQKLID